MRTYFFGNNYRNIYLFYVRAVSMPVPGPVDISMTWQINIARTYTMSIDVSISPSTYVLTFKTFKTAESEGRLVHSSATRLARVPIITSISTDILSAKLDLLLLLFCKAGSGTYMPFSGDQEKLRCCHIVIFRSAIAELAH